MYKYILSLLACISLHAADMISWKSSCDQTVLTDGTSFRVQDQHGVHDVQSCFVDAKLRNKSLSCLSAMKNHGYLNVHRLDRNTYKVDFKERGLGGGPICGSIAYWVTKTVCYGTAVAAAGTAVVATGGLAGAVTGVAVAGATAGAGTAVTVVAAGVAGAGLATEAAVVTAGTVAAAGGVAGAVAAVEAASVGVGSFFFCIPFLP